MRRLLLFVSLAGLVVLVPAAHARVVLDTSIAGIKPRMTETQVMAKLGKHWNEKGSVETPQGNVDRIKWFSRLRSERFAQTSRVLIDFPIKDGKPTGAFYIETDSKGERTKSGIGVGITLTRFHQLFKGAVKCRADGSQYEACRTGVNKKTHAGTEFSFQRNGNGPLRLRSIDIASETYLNFGKPVADPSNPNFPSSFAVTGPDGSPCPCRVGDSITFDSYKPPSAGHAQVVRHDWSFGVPDDPYSDQKDAEATPSYVYSSPGSYTVTVTMTDEAGVKKTLSQQVVIQDAP